MNTRTAFAAFLALGLVTMMVGAPAAGAATAPTDKGPGQCLQIYLFVLDVGPVTVDASDSCPEVTIDSSSTLKPDEICLYPIGC